MKQKGGVMGIEVSKPRMEEQWEGEKPIRWHYLKPKKADQRLRSQREAKGSQQRVVEPARKGVRPGGRVESERRAAERR